MAGYALPTTGLAEDHPTGPRSSLWEVLSTSFDLGRDKSNVLSGDYVLEQEYDKRIAEMEKAFDVKLENPLRAWPTDDDWREAQDERDLPSRGSVTQRQAMQIAERRFHRDLLKLAEQYPGHLAAIRPERTVWDDAQDRILKTQKTATDAIQRSPFTIPEAVPLLGGLNPIAIAGGFGAFATDPVNIASSVVGLGGSAARSVLWNASRQAASGAAQQAMLEPFIKDWHDKLGLQYTWSEAAQNVAFAGVFGGGLDAAGRSLSRALRGVPQGGVPESPAMPGKTPANDVLPPLTEEGPAGPGVRPVDGAFPDPALARADPDAALEAAARRLPEDHPVRRAAEGDAAATVELAERLGPLSDDPAAVRGALDRFKLETLQEASIAEALAAADVEDRLAAHLRHVAEPEANPPGGPPIVNVDDLRMSRRDAEFDTSTVWLHGSRARFNRFDITRGSTPGIWLTLDRAAASAFGEPMEFHVRAQRMGSLRDFQAARMQAGQKFAPGTPEFNVETLAILKQQGFDAIRDPAFRGAGGFGENVMMVVDPDNVRPARDFAQVQALRAGELAPVEAAALLRERPELAAEVPPTTDTARGIHALSRLSDPAFARVADGSMAPELAAIVADAAPPTLHADLIERLAAAAPRDADEARRLVAQMLQRPTDPATAALILRGADAGDGPPQRLRAPEFDEAAGDGAKLQTDSLKGLEDRATVMEDLKLSLRQKAQVTADLDMSPEARKARAEAMGFDTSKILYHGTQAAPFDAFDLDRIAQSGEPDVAVYLTPSSDMASSYAGATAEGKPNFYKYLRTALQTGSSISGKNKGRVLPVYARMNNPKTIRMRDPGYRDTNANEIFKAKREGHDGLIMTFNDSPDEYVVFDPANIRSVNAEFDPSKSDSSNLMARLRDGGDLGGTALSPRFQANAAIAAELAEAARATLPRGVQLEVSQRLAIGAYEADGYFDRRNNILAVALDAADPAFTFSHERIHALHAHGLFTDREWGLLVREAQKRGVRQEMGLDVVQAYRQQLMPSMVKEMLGRRGVADAAKLQWAELEPMLRQAKLIQGEDVLGSLERHGLWDEARLQAMIDEEAVARLAEGWRAGEPLPAGVAGLMQRVMAFLERLRNVLAGHGFHTLDDIFERIDTGEVALRTPREVTLPGGVNVQGIPLFSIRAFHGSPHDFDRFSLDRVGTGEGAQAYGHGLYFAENDAVAKMYRDQLSQSRNVATRFEPRSEIEASFQGYVDMAQGADGGTLSDVRSEIASAVKAGRMPAEAVPQFDAMVQEGRLAFASPGAGRMYEVRINAEPDDFLDWDKPLSQQSEAVRKLARDKLSRLGEDIGPADTGRDLLSLLDAEFGGVFSPNRQAAAKAVRDAGIPGIKYLDQDSRTAGDGSRNYVVFDDALIEIIAKDGQPVTPPWVREIAGVLETATADADAGALVQACKLF